jgi:hypothetical protein
MMQQELKKQIIDTFGERIDGIAYALMKGEFAIVRGSRRIDSFTEETELELLVKGVQLTVKFERWIP